MVEISWGKAFAYGLRYFAYMILWAFIGGLIVAGGALTMAVGGGLTSVKWDTTNQTIDTSSINLVGMIAGMVVMVVGEVVVILGAIASYFKLMAKLITETSPSTLSRPPP